MTAPAIEGGAGSADRLRVGHAIGASATRIHGSVKPEIPGEQTLKPFGSDLLSSCCRQPWLASVFRPSLSERLEWDKVAYEHEPPTSSRGCLGKVYLKTPGAVLRGEYSPPHFIYSHSLKMGFRDNWSQATPYLAFCVFTFACGDLVFGM